MVNLVTPLAKDAQIEAEQSVLGGLLLDNTALSRIAGVITEGDFFSADHRTIFQHIKKEIESGRPADALTVAESLKRSGKLVEVGGQKYIGDLALNTPSAANIRRYAEIVREKSQRRNLAAVGTAIADSAYSQTGGDPASIVAKARKMLAAVHIDHDDEFLPIWIDDAEIPADAQYLIKGLIERGALVLIYGPSGDGKTFFTIDMVWHMAKGLPWRDRRVPRSLAVYVAAEAGTSIVKRICACRDQSKADGQGERTPLAILTRGTNLLDVSDVAALITTLRSLADKAGMPLGVVVFDTLSRSIPGGDENAAEAMTQAIGAADRIRDELGAACIIVHHSGKDVDRGARGHSSLKAAADTVVQVVERVATVEKSRDGVAGDSFPFALEVVELGEDQDGDPITTCVVSHDVEPTPKRKREPTGRNQQIVYRVLRDAIATVGQVMPETSTIPGGAKAITFDQLAARAVDKFAGVRPWRARDRISQALVGLQGGQFVGVQGDYIWIW